MLIDKVNSRVAEGEVTQKTLAMALGLSQGHVSKLLRKTVTPSHKTVRKLEKWMAQQSPRAELTEIAALSKIIEKMDKRRRKFVMQIMHSILSLLRQT